MNSMNAILDSIRPNRSALFSFFSMMPKGGDLHHHYSGSIYAESYIEYVIQKDFFINTLTYEIIKDLTSIPLPVPVEWVKFSTIPNRDEIKLKLLRKWSVKDFVKGARSSDEQFFSTFVGFSIASKENFIAGLTELKKRALNQKLNYIETIFISTNVKSINVPEEIELDKAFLEIQKQRDEDKLNQILEKLYADYKAVIEGVAKKHNDLVNDYHKASNLEDADFHIRYQNYIARFRQPTDVFIELFACFESSSTNELIVGVNIVAAENGETAMRDYWLHIMFYKFLEQKYKTVKYAVHAGELVSGMVQPEFLGTHIKQSLILQNLTRIGHAVDIIYDNDFITTIENLKHRQIAIEINLSSNEFILGVANDLHPIELYYRNGIPIVICTDDEGVLRTSITEQYVLLAHRYKLSYDEIKDVVRNSINYSNIKDDTLKQSILKNLNDGFNDFETKITNFYQPLVFENTNINNLKFMSLTSN